MLVEAAGVAVGIIGVMSIDALRATLPVNVQGLRVVPLAAAVAAEAAKLRAAGAKVVIVGAHAGGACERFDDPADLSSCDPSSEIFELARALRAGSSTRSPRATRIKAWHTRSRASQSSKPMRKGERSPASTSHSIGRRSASRGTRYSLRATVRRRRSRDLDVRTRSESGEPLPTARYEGRDVTADSAVVVAMAPELERVRALQATTLGVILDTPLLRARDAESPLGNLFADAQRERMGADVAINNNVRGGLRADLPEGALTFGRLYDAFPFDNRLVTVTLTGAELGAVVAGEVRRNRPGALAISGARVHAACTAGGTLEVELRRASGEAIGPDERVVVAAMDSLVAGAVFAPARPPAGFGVPPQDAPVMREVVEDWLRERGGRLASSQFAAPNQPRWSDAEAAACLAE